MLRASEASSGVYEVLTKYPSGGGPAGFGMVKHFWYNISCVMAEDEGGHHGKNDGNKIGIIGSHSNTAPSRTGVSYPSEPQPHPHPKTCRL